MEYSTHLSGMEFMEYMVNSIAYIKYYQRFYVWLILFVLI